MIILYYITYIYIYTHRYPFYPVCEQDRIQLKFRAVFLNRRVAARCSALASIIPACEKFSWKLSF